MSTEHSKPPVLITYTPFFRGHLQRLEHLVDRVGRRAQVVRILLFEHFGVGLAAGGRQVVAGLEGLRAQIEEFLDRLAAAGDILLHLFDEVLPSGRQGRVDRRLAVACDGDDAEIVRHLIPVDIQAELVHDGLAAVAGVVGGAEFAQLVQGGLELEAPSAEAGRDAAGQVVLLDEQGLFAGLRQTAGGRKSAVACADDYGIIFGHTRYLLFFADTGK